MKLFKLALAASAATFALGGAAVAHAESTVAFNVGVVSDYVFRGISQTQEDPAIQGGADVTSGIVYGGISAANVGVGGETSAVGCICGGF